MHEPQSLKPRYRTMWLGVLAGLASMTLAWTLHRMLAASQRLPGDTVFTDHSDSLMWLLIRIVDLAGGVAAGMAGAHWSQRWSWRAVVGVLAVLVVNGLMATPSSRDAFRMLLSMLASPVGLLLGAGYYRHWERTQPDVHVPPVPIDHAQVCGVAGADAVSHLSGSAALAGGSHLRPGGRRLLLAQRPTVSGHRRTHRGGRVGAGVVMCL